MLASSITPDYIKENLESFCRHDSSFLREKAGEIAEEIRKYYKTDKEACEERAVFACAVFIHGENQ